MNLSHEGWGKKGPQAKTRTLSPGFPVHDECPHGNARQLLHWHTDHWFCDRCKQTHDDTLPVQLFAPRPKKRLTFEKSEDPILTPRPFTAKLRELGGLR